MTGKHSVLFIRDERGDYHCVDHDPEWLAKVTFVIDNGPRYADLLGPLLVRRGDGEPWFHYPVPFLFKTEEDRKTAATRRGKKPPQEWWVRRKVNLIHQLAGRENKLVA